MGDEEKSIESIIAELEILEAKKKEKALEEKTTEGDQEEMFTGSTVEKSSEELSLEEPHEEMFTEATLDMPEMETVADEKVEESPEEQELESQYEPTEQEPGMGIFPEEFVKEQPDEPETPVEPFAAGAFPQDGPIRDDADVSQSEEPFEESRQEPYEDTVNDENRPDDVPPGGGDDEPPSLPPESGRSTRSLRLVLLFVLLLAGLAAYAYFVWPTMYEYSSIISAGKKYEVRVNRLTGDQQHYDGGVWLSGEIMSPSSQVAKPESLQTIEKEKQPSAEKAPATESSEVEEKTLSKTPEEEPAAVQQSLQEPPQSEAGEAPVASPQPVTEKKTEEPEREESTEEQTSVAEDKTPIKEEKYVVQLGSMKFREFAEALVTKLSRQGFDAHMHSFKSEKTGLWHVVYVGRFNSRGEAVQFLEKHDLKKRYPGSFVRTVTLAPVEAKN